MTDSKTNQTWEVSRMLTDAARLIDTACVNSDEPTDSLLANVDWGTIAGSLEELAADLRSAAQQITQEPQNDSLLVAFDIYGMSRKHMHEALVEMLATHLNPIMNDYGVESYWVAEDDRTDGSDNDSAVFVPKKSVASGHEWVATFSDGYDSAINDVAEWVRIWNAYQGDENDLATLTDEEKERVSSVFSFGGKFEDFVERELFYIRER